MRKCFNIMSFTLHGMSRRWVRDPGWMSPRCYHSGGKGYREFWPIYIFHTSSRPGSNTLDVNPAVRHRLHLWRIHGGIRSSGGAKNLQQDPLAWPDTSSLLPLMLAGNGAEHGSPTSSDPAVNRWYLSLNVVFTACIYDRRLSCEDVSKSDP